MRFDLGTEFAIGHPDAQSVTRLHFASTPDRTPGHFVQGDRVAALEHAQRR